MSNENKLVAIVTGAGGGIGAGIARKLSDDGYIVACVDLNYEAASAVAAALVYGVGGVERIVPPNRSSGRLERRDQPLGDGAILLLVTQEYVSHAPAPPGCERTVNRKLARRHGNARRRKIDNFRI